MLKERISPIAKDMPKATWAEIIQKCYEMGVDLSAKHMYVQFLILYYPRANGAKRR